MKRISTGQAARRLGCSSEHIRALIRADALDAVDCSLPGTVRPRWKVSVESVDQFALHKAVIRSTRNKANRANEASKSAK